MQWWNIFNRYVWRLYDYLLSKNKNLNKEDILGRTLIHYLFVKINYEHRNNNIIPVNTLN